MYYLVHNSPSTFYFSHPFFASRMPPPLSPTTLGFPLSPVGKSVHIELFLDLVCPYSSKMFKTVYDSVLAAYGERVSFVIHQVPQPWHPGGIYMHEVALAVRMTSPKAYPAVLRALVAAYDSGVCTDEHMWHKTRAEMYAELVAIAVGAGGDGDAAAALLVNNGHGVGCTQELKWAIKLHRTRGVHVTPTVFVNGLEVPASERPPA